MGVTADEDDVTGRTGVLGGGEGDGEPSTGVFAAPLGACGSIHGSCNRTENEKWSPFIIREYLKYLYIADANTDRLMQNDNVSIFAIRKAN